MVHMSPSGGGSDLLASIVDACHTAIDKALAAPQEALRIAEGLSGTLATLRLVAARSPRATAAFPP